jgi:hypothetical protein
MINFFFPIPYFGEVVIRIDGRENGASVERKDITISSSYARELAKALLKAARVAEKNEG